jgi:hypothetical protein
MPRLDPGIHQSSQGIYSKKMDHRGKPGDDDLWNPHPPDHIEPPRRVGKGALAPCPPTASQLQWWARWRFAHPTKYDKATQKPPSGENKNV